VLKDARTGSRVVLPVVVKKGLRAALALVVARADRWDWDAAPVCPVWDAPRGRVKFARRGLARYPRLTRVADRLYDRGVHAGLVVCTGVELIVARRAGNAR